ncbi:nitroreductase family deazaflavin-dependent oxidoreductase [Catenulispora rubra]|uniref:nitroreductase family deazaflavin-dependent oxidoreductase n=1 Tax=Catenulispora rubra TaxID=280293 RepID=UPI00189276D9|nr:nitroreductase family deazaflavin-dependent oxidoreductase [Catenulispora rubra]
MATDSEYAPSPRDYVRETVDLYESTDGAEGNTMQGRPIIILTTTGAKTGKVRKTPLMRVEHDGSYAVVASMGGAPTHPVWYHNIVAHPEVELQDGATRGQYLAHEATGEEKTQWWARATQTWPDYDNYQTKTDRQIPLFVLTPR